MSTAAGTESECVPLIPQPGTTPEELRAALAVLAPGALPTFDAERADALQQARDTVSAAPMRRFAGQWAVHIAIERHSLRLKRSTARNRIRSRVALPASVNPPPCAYLTPHRATGPTSLRQTNSPTSPDQVQ